MNTHTTYTATYGQSVKVAPVVGQTLIMRDLRLGESENWGTIREVRSTVSPSGIPMYVVTAFGNEQVFLYR